MDLTEFLHKYLITTEGENKTSREFSAVEEHFPDEVALLDLFQTLFS